MGMKLKSSFHPFVRYIPFVIVFLLILTIVVFSISDINGTSEREGLTITESSVRRAVIICYAHEGSYPADIEYLKQNYGLKISDEYSVYYDIFAPNIMPNITVVRKQVNG